MSRPPLDAGLEEFLSSLAAEHGRSRNTVSAYRRDLRQYLDYLDGAEPDASLIDAWVSHLSDSGFARSTIARKTAAVRGFHRFLVAEGMRETDPLATIEPPRRTDSVPRALDVDDVFRLLEAPDPSSVAGRRDRALLEFLYGTGTRVSETVGLDLADLDLEAGTTRVLGKGARERQVPLGRGARDAIRSWLPDRWELAGTRTDAVFVNLRGRRLTRQGVFDIVRKAAVRAGLEAGDVSPHVLRHSAATHMLERGADLRTVQEILGHANVSTTQVYTRVSPQHLFEIYVQSHPRSR